MVKVVALREALSYPAHQFFVVRTEEEVAAGAFELTLHFSGSLTNGILGFYYSNYTDGNGRARGLATTKFQPTYARRAFPCLDEPGFKSTYSLTVVRPSQGYIALSNMPIKEEAQDSPSEGLTEVAFEKSLPMVTYLVCFIVCDFSYKESVLASGVPFRVYAPESRLSDTRYALDVGKSVLLMYEQMFGLPFPLPKSVTLAWWDDLWLNEGFASYVQYKGAAHVEPGWEMGFQFLSSTLLPVLEDDALLSSHPIILKVETPDQINAIFDKIAYNKGASVLRMLEDFMGAAFQRGINAFLTKFKYSNAVTRDLWRELTSAWAAHVPEGTKGDVGAIMDTWTRQMGYPVVHVRRAARDTLVMTQQRFLLDPSAHYSPDDSAFQYKWDVPLSYVTSADATTIQRCWLYHDNASLEVKVPAEVTWVKVNMQYKGFYRVNYEPDMWAELGKLCSSQTLNAADRTSLYSDVFAMADAGHLAYTVALDFSHNLASESDYVPWNAMATTFINIMKRLESTEAYKPFKAYVMGLVEPLYASHGWQDEGDHLKRLLRTVVVRLACMSGSVACLDTAAQNIHSWVWMPPSPCPWTHADRETNRDLDFNNDCVDVFVQCYRWGVVVGGGARVWEVMWQRALKETSATAIDNLYYGMANTPDPAVLKRYIELSMKEENVRRQNFLSILQYISTNPAGSDLVWDWVRALGVAVERYTPNRYLGSHTTSVHFATEANYPGGMETLFRQYPEGGQERVREQALETVKHNIRWLRDNAAHILAWLPTGPTPLGKHD
ncbi:Glutamyl aminopeptidase [Chionoecetes opilio]|uniref:Aminopeptidase n=1 Tax=Chionoecetes opilio TaxID=41210 RepID=A0A8J4YKK9_CHIOP|nr:Glutamyl aminopeptidase [Chionoecetes opilio]